MAESAHTGHRQRVRARYASDGLAGFHPHEVMELLLFSVIPRRDTNPLAHTLVDRFGGVYGVIGATKAQLMSVEGVSERVADWLTAIAPAIKSYQTLKLKDRLYISTRRRVESFARALPSLPRGNKTWALLVDSGGYLLFCEPVSGGARWGEDNAISLILTLALRYQTYGVIVVSARRDARPTPYDLKKTLLLRDTLEKLAVLLIDHMLIAANDMHSMKTDDVCSVYVKANVSEEIQDPWLSED